MRTALLTTSLLMCGCAPLSRTYEVHVGQEEVCREWEPVSEQCAKTGSATLIMTVRIEDRSDGRALIYGRSDSSAERVYLAEVPSAGRYEVLEKTENIDDKTGCRATRQTILALNVDDQGLDGGEELKLEEGKKCNELKQHRITRRLREWKGSRTR